jgi:hypothetical protein
MSEGFGPREGKIADPVRLVESVFEFEGINIPKGSKKPSFVQYEDDVNKDTVKHNLKKFELLPDIGTSFACVFTDIREGNSWFDAFLTIISPKYRDLSVQDRSGVAKGFRKECARISDSIMEQIPDNFFDAFNVDAKKFKSEIEGSKDINMGFGFFIAWYFGLNLVYLEQTPDGHEIIAPSCYQSEECHAIFMKTHLDRFNSIVVLNLDKEEYDEEESTSVFEWTDKRLCKLKELSKEVKKTIIDTRWDFPTSEDCNATNEVNAPHNKAVEKVFTGISEEEEENEKENARNIDPFSKNNKNKAEAFLKEENSPKPGNTPGENARNIDPFSKNNKNRAEAFLKEENSPKPGNTPGENARNIDPFSKNNRNKAEAFLKEENSPKPGKARAPGENARNIDPFSKNNRNKAEAFLKEENSPKPGKAPAKRPGPNLTLLEVLAHRRMRFTGRNENTPKSNNGSQSPKSEAPNNGSESPSSEAPENNSLSVLFEEEDAPENLSPKTPLPKFKSGILLIKDGSVEAEDALTVFNPSGTKKLTLSSEARDFLDRVELLRNPKYKLSANQMALLVRLLELLKPKAPKKDQLLLEDSQQLLLEDIKDDGSLSPSSEPPNNNESKSPKRFGNTDSPRATFSPKATRKNKKGKNNNASSVNSKAPSENDESVNSNPPFTNNNSNGSPLVKRNNTSKLRIKAPRNENISNIKRSERRTDLRRTRPTKFEKPQTNLVHRTETIGLTGATGVKASSNMLKKGKGSRKNR